MPVEVFDGELDVHYGFGSLAGRDDETPDMDEARAGHTNGLCCAGVPGALSLMFGLHTGPEPLRIEWSDSEPPVDEPWEEVVEASVTFDSPELLLSAFEEFIDVTIPSSGPHRARFNAVGMDAANELDSRGEEEPAPDRYLLQLWPAAAGPDAVVRQTSKIANYWHRVARGEAE